MERIKENVFVDFYDMIRKSWTYQKLTEKEQNKLAYIIFNKRTSDDIKGTYKQRWGALNALYYAFLIALDYDNNPDWRADHD